LSQDSCIDNNMAAFIVDPKSFDIRFIHYLMSAFKLGSLAATGALPSLNGRQLRAIPLRVPLEIDEQRAISETLSDVDHLITELGRLIAKKQAIRQGMMQQLLTGKVRFPGFAEEWAYSTIAGTSRVLGGGTPSTRIATFWGGGIPWFTPAEISPQGSGLVSTSERTLTEEGLARSGAQLLPAGSVLVTSRASIGNCAISAVPVCTNQGFTSLVPRDVRSTWFLYYWVQQYKGEFVSRAAGSTFVEISARKVETIPIALPSLEEQSAIGNALRDVDMEIAGLGARLDAMRDIKQGLMQELLTGRTRLTTAEVAA
jgi:type I restriction enzyme S subunit